MEEIRLDKYVSVAASISRNDVKSALRRGRITVNGNTEKSAGRKIDTEKDIILMDNSVLKYKKYVYILLNKPCGIISASNDKRQKTVVDLLPDKYSKYSLFPVGRLDKDTTGLLIITNDGDFAHRVITPKKEVEKSYIATLDGSITDDTVNAFASGVTLADGTSCRPAKLERISENVVRVVISEGKYHQIKRMFGTQNLPVVKLHRERIGSLTLPKNLDFGEFTELDEHDVSLIFK